MVSSINGKYVQQQEAHYEKLLPQNIEAECSLLGSLLIEPELFSSIKPLLQPDDFYRDSHQTIFEAMLALSLRGVPADFMTLCDELERRHQLEQVGGAAYITSLVNYVPTSGYAMHYAGIVVRTSLQRRLIGAAGKIAAMSYEGEAEEALSQAQKMLNDIALKQVADGLTRASHTSLEVREQLDPSYQQQTGLSTGYVDLDRTLIREGLLPGDLIIWAGRPGTGKTIVGTQLALHNAKQGKVVAFFSLEMRKRELLLRLLSQIASIDLQRLMIAEIYDDEWDRLVEAIDLLDTLELYLDDTYCLTVGDIEAHTQALEARIGRKVDLVIVDYIGLIKPTRKAGNRTEDISEISRGLKELARKLDVPVVALAQLNREVERRSNKKPQLSDLRESGSIEQDASNVFFNYLEELYDEDTERKNIVDIIVAKHRNGPLGEVSLFADKKHVRFLSLETQLQEK